MQLTLRQATSYLNVDEATLPSWIKKRGLPVHRVNEQVYLNPVELWQWAMENGVVVSRRLLDDAKQAVDQVAPLSTLLEAGGIHFDVGGADKSEALRDVVARLPLPAELDRDFLVTVLEAREAMGSTGIGDGIAIPHARNPILLHVDQPLVSLCLLRHPVDFDAVDGIPVHALFVVISPSIPVHLKILARLGLVLRDGDLRRLLRGRRHCAAHRPALAVAQAPREYQHGRECGRKRQSVGHDHPLPDCLRAGASANAGGGRIPQMGYAPSGAGRGAGASGDARAWHEALEGVAAAAGAHAAQLIGIDGRRCKRVYAKLDVHRQAEVAARLRGLV